MWEISQIMPIGTLILITSTKFHSEVEKNDLNMKCEKSVNKQLR